MTVYLSTAMLGNARSLFTLGGAGEIMGCFYPARDHAQHIRQCLPCVYIGPPHHGVLSWTWGDEWQRTQEYVGDTNICHTVVRDRHHGVQIEFLDVVPDANPALVRKITVQNLSAIPVTIQLFHYGDWNMDGVRTGNAIRWDAEKNALVQSFRQSALAIGGDAVQTWQCGKQGPVWTNNAMADLDDGALACQDLEIGDVSWAFGFSVHLNSHESVERTAVFSLGSGQLDALSSLELLKLRTHSEICAERTRIDTEWLKPGLDALNTALSMSASSMKDDSKKAMSEPSTLPTELITAYSRSLLALPLLCGDEGVAIAAPEFDFEFESCGGYGYFWPRDGGEYMSGLLQAGYPQFAASLFDWCARHQDASGLWHQRYFLNGEPGPNWCLPPDMLQIDQVGAVLWAYGIWLDWLAKNPNHPFVLSTNYPLHGKPDHHLMVKKAADYLLTRLTEQGVHANAFDTWETFIGSFTYSNAAIHSALVTAARLFPGDGYGESAKLVKAAVLEHFVFDGSLRRGLNGMADKDLIIDSSSLGAIDPFGMLDLSIDGELKVAHETLKAIQNQLEVDWEGGRAIRRFEGDAYVGGVPACVNTLWMARCSCLVANRLAQLGRDEEAAALRDRAQIYLTTVLRRATPTGLLPELMQGPSYQRYWAAPHGWAMSSFVSGTLMLAEHRTASIK